MNETMKAWKNETMKEWMIEWKYGKNEWINEWMKNE